MTYTEMFCDLGIFGALLLAVVVGALVLMVILYGALCVLAWIEDEIGRAVKARRRRARLRERARWNRVLLQPSNTVGCEKSKRRQGWRI